MYVVRSPGSRYTGVHVEAVARVSGSSVVLIFYRDVLGISCFVDYQRHHILVSPGLYVCPHRRRTRWSKKRLPIPFNCVARYATPLARIAVSATPSLRARRRERATRQSASPPTFLHPSSTITPARLPSTTAREACAAVSALLTVQLETQ